MNFQHLYVKTELGIAELTGRKLKLSQPLRNALILVDKSQTFEKLQRDASRVGAPADFIEQLLSMGLIVISSSPSLRLTPASNNDLSLNQSDEFTLFRTAKEFMNTTVVNALGMRSFFFVLKLEKAGARVDLRALIPDYAKAMGKSLDPQTVDVMVERVTAMLA